MPTNEGGLSGGKDQGDGGRTTASDTPGGEQSAGAGQQRPQGSQSGGIGQDRGSPGQVSTQEMDRTDGGHLGRGGDPVEGRTDPAATGEGPQDDRR